MRLTMFHSVFDKEKAESDRTWPQVVERAHNPREYPRKDAMPLLKLAVYGEHRSNDGFLRNGANIDFVSGSEGDYDGERAHPEEALTSLGMANVRALVYTSPSHTPDKPRWRVLLPFSVELPAGHRAAIDSRTLVSSRRSALSSKSSAHRMLARAVA